MEYAISARGLRKSFKLSAKQRKLERTDARVKTAVDGLSFDVAPGEIYGLLGPNGAGKTTTLRMLAALVKPDEGDALIEGVSVVDDPAGVRSLIGFLTSELKLEDVFSPDYCSTSSPSCTMSTRPCATSASASCSRASASTVSRRRRWPTCPPA